MRRRDVQPIIELLVRYGTRSRPGIGGAEARPPTLMKMRSAAQDRVADLDLVRRLKPRVAV